MKIVTADQRLAERRGVKALIIGPAGVGKTSLLRTLDPARTFFVDNEGGDLAVQDIEVDTIRLNNWTELRDLACRIGGPNLSFPPTACYSQAHYEAIGGALENLDRYDTIFVDSITAVSRLSFRGHADGVLTAGPDVLGIGYPSVWEHKCLGATGWREIERNGLEKARPQYVAQILIYQPYLDLTEHPAVFTAVNADTCERLHLLVPFSAEQAQAWSDRAVTVIEATLAGELLPRAFDDSTDWRCKMCGHRERCWR
jgi:AAA domain-containing protein